MLAIDAGFENWLFQYRKCWIFDTLKSVDYKVK